MPRHLVLASFAALALASAVAADHAAADHSADRARAIKPTDVIRLFDGKDISGLVTWLQDAKHQDPRHVYTVQDGMLCISGDGLGYLRTKKQYRDYHLVIEFRWGGKTWGKRVDRARDSGVIVHCMKPDGSLGGVFMAGIEAQIIEGGCGDFIVCTGKDAEGKPLTASLTAEVAPDRDGEQVWTPGGAPKVFNRGRINWFGRDADWQDKIGFRGKADVESPGLEWTRMDVICDGDRIVVAVNGVKVNEGFQAQPSFGEILVQCELAEIVVRKWELWPLGKLPGPKPPRLASAPK